MSDLKKFFTQFSHFLTGNAFSILLGLITFPILTRVLTIEQYGIMGLVTTTMSVAVAFSKAGLSNGMIRFYQKYRSFKEERTVFVSTVVYTGLLISTITTCLYLGLFPVISRYLGLNQKFIFCFLIMAAYLFIRPLNIIVINMLRVNDKTIFINVINLCAKIIAIILSLSFLIYIVHDLYGYFFGLIIAEYLLAIALFYWFFLNYKINSRKISKDIAVNLIKFGAPLLVTEIAYLLLSYADRYMIVAWQGESALGIYSVGYNLAMYLANILTFSLGYAVIPVYVRVYEEKGRGKTEEFLNKTFYYLVIAILPICFGYYVIVEELFILLASNKYVMAASFSPIILVGTFVMEMNNIFNAGLYLKKKSMTILFIMLTSVVVNIVLNIILIPRFGIMGAAIATLLSCMISSILTISLSFRFITVSFSIKHVVYYLFLSIVMFSIVKHIHIAGYAVNVFTKIVAGICIIIPGVLLKEKDILFFIKKKLQDI